MPASVRRSVDLAVPALLGATVFAFAAGSSSLKPVNHVGRGVRWVLLACLAAAALAYVRDVRALPRLVPSAAAALAGLALLSTAWSVDPRLSVQRGITLAVLFAAAVLVAGGVRVGRVDAEAVLVAALAAAAAAAVAGLLVLAFGHRWAVQAAAYGVAARYRGFGENPNTDPLLFSLALPVAAWQAVCGRTRAVQTLAALAALLFAGSIAAADSRGALVAGFVASVVVIVGASRGGRRLFAAAAATAVTGAALYGATIPSAPKVAPAPAKAASAPANPYDVERAYPLEQDVGTPLPGGGQKVPPRTFFDTSGRGQAWTGAAHLIAGRPLLGYGFGTEEDVFVDRYAYFAGSRPENSYLGIALQLGVVGLLALLLIPAAAARGLRRAGPIAVAAAGVVLAGLLMAVVQSYLYSVGNLAALPFWIATMLLAALVSPREAAAT